MKAMAAFRHPSLLVGKWESGFECASVAAALGV
jgi:hypothetical protein